jgi:hypothetical protein
VTRPIVEYRLEPEGSWLVCLGCPDETADDVARFLVTHHAAVETRPRDGVVTDNGAGFRGCVECGGDFWAKRRDARYCCAGCRQRASRSRRRDPAPPPATSGAGNACSSIAYLDEAAVGADAPEFDPREVFGFADPRRTRRGHRSAAPTPATVKASASTLATRSGGSSSTRTNGETR